MLDWGMDQLTLLVLTNIVPRSNSVPELNNHYAHVPTFMASISEITPNTHQDRNPLDPQQKRLDHGACNTALDGMARECLMAKSDATHYGRTKDKKRPQAIRE